MCNNTLPKFKLEDNMKLIDVMHAKKRRIRERWRLMMTHGKSSTEIIERDVTGLACQ